MKMPISHLTERERERWLRRYVAALDMGDADGIARALEAAAEDEALTARFMEVELALLDEHGAEPVSRTASTVGRLAQVHLGQPAPATSLTVGHVARHVPPHAISPPESARLRLVECDHPLPDVVTTDHLASLLQEAAGIEDRRYARHFKEAVLWLRARSSRGALALAARAARPPREPSGGTAAFSARSATPEERVAQALGALLHPAAAPGGLVVLADVLDGYPIVVQEVPGLTTGTAMKAASRRGFHLDLPEGAYSDRRLSGLLFAHLAGSAPQGFIFVEANDPVERRRFTIGHELGHFLLHFLPLVDAAPGEGTPLLVEGLSCGREGHPAEDGEGEVVASAEAMWGLERMEREANLFAACLLMPEPTCHLLAQKYGARYGSRRDTLVRPLAAELLVSRPAMARRLADLGLGS